VFIQGEAGRQVDFLFEKMQRLIFMAAFIGILCGGLRFSVTDNGFPFDIRSNVMYDGIREYPVSLFDGELRIINAQ
jgi:hypothetical protein